jgi:hypothetical protein
MTVKLGDIRKLPNPDLSEYVFSLLFKEQFKDDINVKKMFLQSIFVTPQKSKHDNGQIKKVNFALYMQHDRRDLLKHLQLRQMNKSVVLRSIGFAVAGTAGLLVLAAGAAMINSKMPFSDRSKKTYCGVCHVYKPLDGYYCLECSNKLIYKPLLEYIPGVAWYLRTP